MEGLHENEIEKWGEWFLRQFGPIRDAFLAHKESSNHITSVFLSSHFKAGFETNTGGMLIDLGIGKEGQGITAVGATFSKNADVLYVSRSLLVFEGSSAGHADTLAFSGEKRLLSESAEGFIKYEIDGSVFRLLDLKATLQYWNQREETYAPVVQWNIEEYRCCKFEILCSACFGEGASQQMSIPKADYESGLSGYALFSCNRTNGTYGCKACGGMGAKYEEWYLKENPGLKNSPEEFRKGRGSILHENINEIDLRTIEQANQGSASAGRP